MLIDEVKITLQAGKGGDGLVHFYTDRWRPKGGPDGGNGGDGGNVYFRAVSDISKLHQFRHQKNYEAQDGQKGGPNNCTGKNGEDLYLEIPYGSVVTYDNGTEIELDHVGQIIIASKGGRGGKGNHHYRSATNQTPKEHTAGFNPPIKNVHIQLKLIADIGLIGLPNAGKTSLLNELTTANAQVANYAFTTLEPNLGVMKSGQIIADIPGLIEGASDGKGLGYKFLKHVERTRVLVHCVSAESSDPVADYQTVRKELEMYSEKLVNKPEMIVLTKSDLLDEKQIKKISKSIKANLSVSIADDASLKKLSDLVTKMAAPPIE
ncbi:MAG: GTPase ObgE [Candidatus Shapirobacteria bacterium]|jgi:GTP-binding protein